MANQIGKIERVLSGSQEGEFFFRRSNEPRFGKKSSAKLIIRTLVETPDERRR